MPAVIVEKLVGNKAHIVELGQKIEQRVTWLPDQDLVARITKKPEEKAVGFAGAGGKEDLLRVERSAMVMIVAAYGLASGAQALWIRIVKQRRRVYEWRQDRRVVGKAAARRVRGGQVPKPCATGAQPRKLLSPRR